MSSWVSPADNEPRASNRSRSPSVSLVRRIPITKPSIRCTAIGNQVFIIVAIVSALMTKNSDGWVTCIVAVYDLWSLAPKNALNAPEYTPR